jgi:hypothetical protein
MGDEEWPGEGRPCCIDGWICVEVVQELVVEYLIQGRRIPALSDLPDLYPTQFAKQDAQEGCDF